MFNAANLLESAYCKSMVVTVMLVASSLARAENLTELLNLARASEPNYLTAKANLDIAVARKEQAMGAMLPQVSIAVNANSNDREYQTRNALVPEQKDNYSSDSAQINLTQSVLRPANYYAYKQSLSVEMQAQKQLEAADQELIVKLSQAWFEWLGARDSVLLAEQQLASAKRQFELAERGHQVGTHGVPELTEASTKMAMAQADLAANQAEQLMKMAALEQLTGLTSISNPPQFNTDPSLPELEIAPLETWLRQVDQASPKIFAALNSLEAASFEVSKQEAGHLPTLDVVASYGKNSQEVGGFPGQAGYDITQGTLGLQLSIPVYSGGMQSARVREAAAQKFKTLSDVTSIRRQSAMDIKQAWYGWSAGKSRALAGQLAIASAESAHAAATRGFDLGLQTELQVLQADQQLMLARRDFNKVRYDQLLAWVRLKAAAGQLTQSEVVMLDQATIPTAKE